MPAVEKTVITSLKDIFDNTHQIAVNDTANFRKLNRTFLTTFDTKFTFNRTGSKSTIYQTRMKIFLLYRK